MYVLVGYSNFEHPLLFTSTGTRAEFAPENIVVAAGINELKSSSRALLSHWISIYQDNYSTLC